MMTRTYTELSRLKTLEERFDYLKLDGEVAKETFGFDRYLNQKFYKSYEWQRIRDHVIARDMGCEMGLSGYEIRGQIVIHHLNPICLLDLEENLNYILDMEYLVCVSKRMHNAIHYGDKNLLPKEFVERKLFDTCPWR